ncbi:Hypothetical predicted protein [Olea europaea subsp. europaea]|uniref:Uncharacterized protein n=1 Tax=Olea europaea subsp. europaea TaxID=158383 RepID=A0A8S0QGQ9_OLEEU|nr:Hypothetical predicted protein [Olea europaea subsp. europaea]
MVGSSQQFEETLKLIKGFNTTHAVWDAFEMLTYTTYLHKNEDKNHCWLLYQTNVHGSFQIFKNKPCLQPEHSLREDVRNVTQLATEMMRIKQVIRRPENLGVISLLNSN